MAKLRLGSGERFRQLEEKIARRGKVRNSAAVAATIGRKKYGKVRFQKLAAQGRKNPSPPFGSSGVFSAGGRIGVK